MDDIRNEIKAIHRMLNKKYIDIRYKAKKKFGTNEDIISYEDFIKISSENCTYCKSKPSLIVKDFYFNKKRKIFKSKYIIKITGIDRIDSNKSYVKGNVNPCCSRCNFMKGKLSKKEFVEHIKKIYEMYVEKK